MLGRRRRETDPLPSSVQPGDYWKTPEGWMGCTPSGLWCNLTAHEVVELEDGTITAMPSILTWTKPDKSDAWHGYLERGVWRAC